MATNAAPRSPPPLLVCCPDCLPCSHCYGHFLFPGGCSEGRRNHPMVRERGAGRRPASTGGMPGWRRGIGLEESLFCTTIVLPCRLKKAEFTPPKSLRSGSLLLL